MSRRRIGLSRTQSWGEPFIGKLARDYHELAGDCFADFQSSYRAHLYGFNRPGVFGFDLDGENEGYLRPLDHDPVNPNEIEFYNGLTEEDFEREKRVNWSGRCTESGRSGNGYFVKIASPLRVGSLIRRFEPLSTPEFESLVERIRGFYK